MCATLCFVFAFLHMVLWWRGTRRIDYLIIVVMATAVGCNVILEMVLLSTTDVDQYIFIMKLGTFAIFVTLMALLWFIRVYLQAGSHWLLGVIALLWTISLITSFLSSDGGVFSELATIGRSETFWGEQFSHPSGIVYPINMWGDVATLLILVYLTQATWRSWRRDRHKRAIIIGGSSILFILLAGVHTPLVDMGLIRMPYMIGFAFLAIVAALTFRLLNEWLETQRDLLQARRDLDRVSRAVALGEVAAGLAHELNQPLSAVLSNAQAGRRILAKNDPDLVEIREIFEDIIADDKRAGEVVHGLRAMLREETDESVPVDICSEIQFVARLLSGEFSARDVTVKMDLAPNIPLAQGSKVQVQQVIMNLSMNAVHALDAKPRSERHIRFSAAASDDEVRVSVLDDGPGFDAHLLDKLFTPFVSSQNGGLGIGLAICRRIVERNGGRIWVERTGSSGTEVCFTLPFANGKGHV